MQIDLFKDLEPSDVTAIAHLGSRMTLPAGSVLFRLGADADSLYAIERGRVSLTLPMRVGDREQDVLVEERAGGETIGWSAVVPPYRFTLTATVLMDSEIVAFSRARLLEHFTAHPDVGVKVTRNVAAVIGQRLQVLQTMWLREMQRLVQMKLAGQGVSA